MYSKFMKLKKEEREHLIEIGCTTLSNFKETRRFHHKLKDEYIEKGFINTEPCSCCRTIALKLKLEE